MAKKRKSPKPEAKLPVDPNAPVFQVGDEIVVKRHNILWSGYSGVVESVDGGMCHCRLWALLPRSDCAFHADIPAAELALDL